MALTLQCSSCGGAVTFSSRASTHAICPYCQSMLVRRDMDVESLGKVALLQEDFSPLKVGSEGMYAQKAFILKGRIRRGWKAGYWFEWYMDFGDEREAWLGEAQGHYMVSFLTDTPQEAPALENLQISQNVEIAGKMYQVKDLRETFVEGAEGELPYTIVQGQKATCVDLGSSDHRFATLDYGEDALRVYVGEYVDLPSLRMKNMRELDGW